MPGIRKYLVFSKYSVLLTIYKNDHINDIHVNTKVLTTGLVIPSGTKRPPAVASTQDSDSTRGVLEFTGCLELFVNNNR